MASVQTNPFQTIKQLFNAAWMQTTIAATNIVKEVSSGVNNVVNKFKSIDRLDKTGETYSIPFCKTVQLSSSTATTVNLYDRDNDCPVELQSAPAMLKDGVLHVMYSNNNNESSTIRVYYSKYNGPATYTDFVINPSDWPGPIDLLINYKLEILDDLYVTVQTTNAAGTVSIEGEYIIL